MSWEACHPDEMSIYERIVGHPVRSDTPIGAGEFFVHPDECDACKDPEVHAQVQANMKRIQLAITAIRPFFDDDTPAELMLNIGMSFYMTMNNAQVE